MIATLAGKLLLKNTDRAVVDVGGVGYEVFFSHDGVAWLPDIGDEVFLHIHTNVREDAITLFGFLEEEEREMFLILKSVSGVGPKLALSILSGIRVGELCHAIVGKDISRLTALQGIGKKTAERLCLDLKDKVGHLGHGEIEPGTLGQGSIPAGSSQMDALSALINLGYPDPVARKALAAVKKQVGQDAFMELSIEDLIRHSLQSLS